MRKYQALYKNMFVKLYLLELNKTVPIYRKVIELMITRNCYNLVQRNTPCRDGIMAFVKSHYRMKNENKNK